MRIRDWSSDVCSSDLVVEATPDLADTEAVFRIHWYSGAANLLQRFDAAAQATMEPGLQAVAAEGRGYSLLDYLDAVSRREKLVVAVNSFHQTYDLPVTPSLPIPAFPACAGVPPRTHLPSRP